MFFDLPGHEPSWDKMNLLQFGADRVLGSIVVRESLIVFYNVVTSLIQMSRDGEIRVQRYDDLKNMRSCEKEMATLPIRCKFS